LILGAASYNSLAAMATYLSRGGRFMTPVLLILLPWVPSGLGN